MTNKGTAYGLQVLAEVSDVKDEVSDESRNLLQTTLCIQSERIAPAGPIRKPQSALHPVKQQVVGAAVVSL